MKFKSFGIEDDLPPEYRLATVDEVVQHKYGGIRLGTPTDVQDIASGYFDYEDVFLSGYDKTRLKNGFVDNRRKLAWKQFGGLFVVEKLAVACSNPPELSDDDRVVALLYACLAEDVEEAKHLIEDCPDIIRCTSTNAPCRGTAVHLCAWEGKMECLKLLLTSDKDAAVTRAKQDEETALLVATLRGWEEAVKQLLDFDKRQINSQTREFKSTPLMMAVHYWLCKRAVCEQLLNVPDIQIEMDDVRGNTALHLAVQYKPAVCEDQRSKPMATMELLLEHCGCRVQAKLLDPLRGVSVSLDETWIARAGKSYRKNLPFNAVNGSKRGILNKKNKRGETPLHLALVDDKVPIQFPSLLICVGADIQMTDSSGQNALHRACNLASRKGIVQILQKCFPDSKEGRLEWSRYTCRQDIAGQTALHIAAFSGNLEAVSVLLDPKFNTMTKTLVQRRDYDDKTTLHCAAQYSEAQSKDTRETRLEIVKKILQQAGSKEDRYLLLWAIAETAGTADQCITLQDDTVKKFLKQKRLKAKDAEPSINLLELSLKSKRHDMTVELINRGADVEDERVKKHEGLHKFLEQHRSRTTDRPSGEDLLDREDIRDAIAAILLNRHMGSPITIGIFGGSEMGKSSLMLQVQQVLLLKAARQAILADPVKPPEENDFPGALKQDHKLNAKAKSLHREVAREIGKREQGAGEKKNKMVVYLGEKKKKIGEFLSKYNQQKQAQVEKQTVKSFLSKYREEYAWIFKRLALANRGKPVPAVLTVQYDAWQYESKDEAWAGLAVEILKEMEGCMTTAQLLRICWVYSFTTKPRDIFLKLILPVLLTVLLGGLIAWAAWKLLSLPKSYELDKFKYGSLPVSVIVIFWVVLTKIIGVVQPVSQQLLEYTKLPAHESKLGYQHQVIRDINFLRKEMCKEPSLFLFWKVVASLWRTPIAFVGSNDEEERTESLKRIPPRDNLRIVVFIDNLDRRKEELLAPLNLILASCDINAVVAIDKGMVQDAMQREFGIDKGMVEDAMQREFPDKRKFSDNLGEKFLSQLIQIPIVLPDPGVDELKKKFLKGQLNDPTEDQSNRDGSQTENPEIEEVSDYEETNQSNPVSDMERSKRDPPTKRQSLLSCCYPEDTVIDVDQDNDGGSSVQSVNEWDKDWRAMNISVLDSNYSRGEIEVFRHLAKHTFDDYRSPRAWKSLINYHRLVRSIMTHPLRRSTMKGWKRQLIVWVFVCWQWREQMDDIIEHWSELVQIPPDIKSLLKGGRIPRLLARSSSSAHEKELLKALAEKPGLFEEKLADQKDSGFWDWVNGLYPSLRKIAKKRMKKIFSSGESKSPKTRDDQRLEEEAEVETTEEGGEEEEEMEEAAGSSRKRAQWYRMRKALKVGKYDVTMQGIQAFQQFRFDCKAGFLEVPCREEAIN